jgi:predicted MFS family arabinose efflux permease
MKDWAIGLAQSPSQPARASLVMDLVGRQNLSNANALNSMALSMTQVIGPALGGLMITGLGAPAALWVSTFWYAVSLVTLLPLRGYGRVTGAPTGSAVRMVTSGLRDIARNRLASTVLLVTLAANTLLWPIAQSFMPVFAQESLGLDAAGLGWLLTCAGVGGLAGSLVIAWLGDFRFKGGMFVVGTAIWGALWSLFGLSHDTVVSFVLMTAIGVLSAAFGVLQTTLLLMTTDVSLHGRVLGVQELAIGIMPVASLALGAFAEQYGVGITTFVSAVLLVVLVAALAIWTPSLLRYSGTRLP